LQPKPNILVAIDILQQIVVTYFRVLLYIKNFV